MSNDQITESGIEILSEYKELHRKIVLLAENDQHLEKLEYLPRYKELERQILQSQKDAQEYNAKVTHPTLDKSDKCGYCGKSKNKLQIWDDELFGKHVHHCKKELGDGVWLQELVEEKRKLQSKHKKLVDAVKDLHFIDVAYCFPRIIESKKLTSLDLVLLQIIIRHFDKLQNLLKESEK